MKTESDQSLNTIAKEIKELKKQIKYLGPEPLVIAEYQHIETLRSIEDLTPEEIYEGLKAGGTLTCDYDENVHLSCNRVESEEEYSNRIHREKMMLARWTVAREDFRSKIAALEAKASAERQDKNNKYKDPEYIEYLRIQSKLKERGVI
jgi:hypothetical protein